jgi:hypothetical protein
VQLTADQRVRIAEIAAAEGITVGDVVRRAIGEYLDEAWADPGPALAATLGALPDMTAPSRSDWRR